MIQENKTTGYTKVNCKDKTDREIDGYFENPESAKDQASFLIYMVIQRRGAKLWQSNRNCAGRLMNF